MKTTAFGTLALAAFMGAASAAPLESRAAPETAPALGPNQRVTALYNKLGRQSSKATTLTTSRFAEDLAAAAPPAPAPAAADSSRAASAVPACTNDCSSTLKFAGKAAKAFEVGNSIPAMPFKTRTSWAGLLPIKKGDTSRELFFWLWGKDVTASDKLVIWLNGGPGCSSLNGMMQENGPIQFLDINKPPVANPDSWTTAANILYVEQPVGTGFTVGKPVATSENDIAADFTSWLRTFYDTFPELKSKKLYITGESYAGAYVPAIANAIYRQGNPFNLQGEFIVDGVVVPSPLYSDVPSLDYLVRNKDVLRLRDNDTAAVEAAARKCGFTTFVQDNLNYPPRGKLPAYNRDGCNVWETLTEGAIRTNQYFNVYRATDIGKPPTSPLGDPNLGSPTLTYFDRSDVRAYIHAPARTGSNNWELCSSDAVFPKGDSSPSPSESILPYVISQSKAGVIIANGQLDELIQTNGIALGLQNMTWKGTQGFQKPITQSLVGTDGKKAGTYRTERGLTFAIVDKAGHMIPQDTPKAGLALLKALLGERSLSG